MQFLLIISFKQGYIKHFDNLTSLKPLQINQYFHYTAKRPPSDYSLYKNYNKGYDISFRLREYKSLNLPTIQATPLNDPFVYCLFLNTTKRRMY